MCSISYCRCLDDGRLTDNKGRVVDFKNTIIIMTSNIGSHLIQENFSKLTDENEGKVIEDTPNGSNEPVEKDNQARIFKPH